MIILLIIFGSVEAEGDFHSDMALVTTMAWQKY
jgi:hypothetical protein